MLTVILVDDDKSILSGLQKLICWSDHDCVISGAFLNPFEALDHCKQEQPNIVITDIRMPGLSGIELAGRLNDLCPDTICIVLTAYGDFSYAQQAVSKGVFRYLLKPINENDLIQVIDEAGKLAASKLKNAREHRELEVFRERQACLDTLYALLASPQDVPAAGLNRKLFRNGHLAPYRLAVMLRTGNLPADPSDDPGPDCFVLQTGDYTLFVMPETGRNDADISTAVSITEGTYRRGGSCAFSCTLPTLRDLHDDQLLMISYLRAMKFIHPGKDVFSLRYMPEASDPGVTYVRNHLKNSTEDLSRCFIENDYVQLRETLKGLSLLLEEAVFPPSPETIKDAFTDSVIKFRNYILQYYSAKTDWLDLTEEHLRKISGCESLQQILLICENLYAHLYPNHFAGNAPSSAAQTINAVKSFVALNLNRDININDIAENVHISPSYLSALFRRTTGEKLWSYVSRMRLDKSYDYLVNTELPIAQISEMCGFNNINTFYYSFKKQFGFAPGKLRSPAEEAPEDSNRRGMS